MSSNSNEALETVTLSQWFHHGTSSGSKIPNIAIKEDEVEAKERLPLIDLRSQESFSKRRLLSFVGSSEERQVDHDHDHDQGQADDVRHRHETVVVHLPFETLLSGERSCELPPRDVKFAILMPLSSSSTSSSTSSSSEKESIILDFFFATRSKVTLQSRKPWLVKQIIYENESMWKEATELGISHILETDTDRNRNREKNRKETLPGAESFKYPYVRSHVHVHVDHQSRPLPRLWKPDNMIQTILLPLLKQKVNEHFTPHSMLTTATSIDVDADVDADAVIDADANIDVNSYHHADFEFSPFTIWDLGSGAGRDVCFLAEELNYVLHQHQHQHQHQQKDDQHQSSSTSTPSTSKLTPILTPLKLAIVGIDNHKGSSKRCIPLWKHRNVQDITHSLLLDLNKLKSLKESMLWYQKNDIMHMGMDMDMDMEMEMEKFNKDNINHGSDNHDHDHDDKNGSTTIASTTTNFTNSENHVGIRSRSATATRSTNCSNKNNNDGNSNGVICLYAIRFLNRKLIHYIAHDGDNEDNEDNDKGGIGSICSEDDDALEPMSFQKGTLFAMSHFCKSHDGAIWDFDHPKVKSVLERNELSNLFTKTNKWKILHDEICLVDGDHGRTLIHFVAERI